MTVLAVDPTQTTNAQRVVDLDRLGYLPGPVLDPTYGYGGMWTEHRPSGLVACDLDERRGVTVADFRTLPFPSDSFGSLLLDPPYRLGGTPTTNTAGGMDDRYGIDRYRTPDETATLIADGTTEAARVVRPGGFVIVKCAAQVVSGRVRWQTDEIAAHATTLGLRHRDELHLIGGRSQPAGRRQLHARRNHSTFVVFVVENHRP